MNLNAINTAISKAFYKGQTIHIGELDEKTVGVTIDGYVMWFIPKKDFIFDEFTLLRGKNLTDIKRLINTEGYTDAILTNELILFEKKTLVKFIADDIEVYVDKKLLKTFDPRLSTYKVKMGMSSVLVYENDTLVGAVMPIQYNSKN